MAFTQISTLSLKSFKNGASKIALGSASLMMLAVIGTSGVAGATELEGSSMDKNATSVSAQQDKDKKNNKDHDNRSDKGREHGKNGDNRGAHGYGGANTTVHNNINANQNGHDNVFTIVYNYFFS